MTSVDLQLDPKLRNWVLLPILFIMFLIGILRHYILTLLRDYPKPRTVQTIKEQENLNRGRTVLFNGGAIPASGLKARKEFLVSAYKEGKYLAEPEKKDEQVNPMANPAGMDAMTAQLKGNLVNIVPQTIIMSWVNYFFSGFILMKLPFPLTLRFKTMLQSGVATRDLDARWVSSISWYFLNLFGLQSVYSLVLGSSNNAGNGMETNQMPTMAQPGVSPHKVFLAEADNLEIYNPPCILDEVEKRILVKYFTS